MVQDIIGVLVIVLVYVCVFIVVFSPTLYAFWIYLVSRKVKMKRKGFAGDGPDHTLHQSRSRVLRFSPCGRLLSRREGRGKGRTRCKSVAYCPGLTTEVL